MAKLTSSTKSPSGLPAEYKKGRVRFLGCRIDLSERVFIPRPETEFWVKAAIDGLKKTKNDLKVLDVFSGSGCAGIAVLKKITIARVDFSEIDPRVVSQIKKNLLLNGIDKKRYRVFVSDIFKQLPAERYDLILANPPYVDPARIKEVQVSVLGHEPHTALFGGKRGMAVIKKFLRRAKKHLDEKGLIYMEFDALQAGEIAAVLKKENYSICEFFPDQFGRIRFAKIGI